MKLSTFARAVRSFFASHISDRPRGVTLSERHRRASQGRTESLEDRCLLTVNLGVARPDLVNSPFLMDQFLDNEPLSGARDAAQEIDFEFGFSNAHASATVDDTILAGDFSGVGFDQIVAARGVAGATQWLGDTDRDTDQEYLFRFGFDTDTPLIADMNADGFEDIIAVRQTGAETTFFVHFWDPSGSPLNDLSVPTDYFSDSTLIVDVSFTLQEGLLPTTGDIPIVGDFNGDGQADVGVVRDDGIFFDWYVFSATSAYANGATYQATLQAENFGFNNDVPVVDDWDNDGDANFGYVDENVSPSQWNLDTDGLAASIELTPQFGLAGDQYYSGNWADTQWNGNTNANWSTAANWSGGVLPGATDDVLVDTGSGTAINIDVAVNVNSLDVRDTVQLGANVTTSAAQTYADSATLTANATLSGMDITFDDTVDGTFDLTVNSSGVTAFNDLVGDTTPLASLATDGAGSTQLNVNGSGVGVEATGNITFADATTSSTASVISSAGNVTFQSTLDAIGGAQVFVSASGGTVTTQQAVGGINPLVLFRVGSAYALNGGSVTTGGDQIYDEQVTLGANTTLTVGGNGTFNNIDGAFDLAVNSPGTVILGDQIGGTATLASLTTDAGGTTIFGEGTGGATALTATTATFNDAVVVDQGLTTLLTFGDLTFNSTLNAGVDAGGEQLILRANGNTVTNADNVGATTPFGSFQIDFNSVAYNLGGDVTTTGLQGYGAPTTLTGNARLIGTSVAFANSVDGGAFLRVSGDATFSGSVGSTTPLSEFRHDTGVASFNAESLTTTGDLTFAGDIVLDSPTDTVTFDSSTGIFLGNSSGNHLRSLVDGEESLFVNTSGPTFISAGVGNNGQRLRSFVSDAGGTLTTPFGMTATEDITFNDAVTSRLSSIAGRDITFAGTLNGPNDKTTTVNATGTVTFAGIVGGTTAPRGISIASSTGVTIGDTFTIGVNGFSAVSDGTISVNGAMSAGTAADISLTTATNIVLDGGASITAVDSSIMLTADATIDLQGPITGTGAANDLIVSAAGINVSGGVSLGGEIDLTATDIAGITLLSDITAGSAVDMTSDFGVAINNASEINAGSTLTINADADLNGTGDVGASVQSLLSGNGISVAGRDVQLGRLQAQTGDLFVSASNDVMLNQFGVADGDITVSANNDLRIPDGAQVNRPITADADANGAGSLILTADADASGVGNLIANTVSDFPLSGATVLLSGAGISVGRVASTTGDATFTATTFDVDFGDKVVTSAGNLTINAPVGEITQAAGGDISAIGSTNFNQAGNLIVNGVIQSDYTVLIGTSLFGSGTIGAVTANDLSFVKPGNSPGILNTGDFDLQAGSTLEIEIGGLNPGNTINDHDQVNVTGSVTLAGDMNALRFNGFNPSAGDTFTIINNDLTDAVSGTFNGLAEGAEFTTDNVTYSVSYVGGDGNDVALTAVGTTFTVTNLNGSGVGSLHQAVLDANTVSGPDTITFDVAGPLQVNPSFPIPTVTDPVTIDATTAPGFAGAPVFELHGAFAGAVNGLEFGAGSDGSVVRGLSITAFDLDGINIAADGIRVTNNWLGLNLAGNADGNAQNGVRIEAAGATISNNVISANASGVLIDGIGADNNAVTGNTIGLNAAGDAAIGNDRGVVIEFGPSGNTIGTNGDGLNDASEGNVISGQTGAFGVGIQLSDADNNVVAGNIIGLNAAGDAAIPNAEGVWVHFMSAGNLIGSNADGTSDTLERNIISGNTVRGVRLDGDGTNTTIAGNDIGTNAPGNAAIANGTGVFISASTNNLIGGDSAAARNVISGNTGSGVDIQGGAFANTVSGNFIGTAADGVTQIGQLSGIDLADGSTNNVIGGGLGEGNIIAGHTDDGIRISGATTTGNLIAGNTVIDNGLNGIFIDGTPANIIGTNADGTDDAIEGNIIGGNNQAGIFVNGTDSTGTTIAGNEIGLVGANSDGVILADAMGVIIGGDSAEERNVISGNTGDGVFISGASATDNIIGGNFIGTDVSGNVAVGNATGIRIQDGANNTVGFTPVTSGNVISGNTSDGVFVTGATADGITIAGNLIGTNASGSAAVANSGHGVSIGGGATNVQIGRATETQRNIISGNFRSGIVAVQAGFGLKIQNNFIGTDVSGTNAIGNAANTAASDAGINLSSFAGGLIGTDGDGIDDANEGNVISGNLRSGIRLQGGNGTGNFHTVAGNNIGVDVSGTDAIGNTVNGITITSSSNNVIGSDLNGISDALEGNIIAGNGNVGAQLSDADVGNGIGTDGNTFTGNFFGTDRTASLGLGNFLTGILVDNATNTTIGGTLPEAANVIAFHLEAGVNIQGVGESNVSSTQTTTAQQNSIFGNGFGIDLRPGPQTTLNDDPIGISTDGILNFPILTDATVDVDNNELTFEGIVTAGSTIELYISHTAAGDFGQGQIFLGTFVEGSGADLDAGTTKYGTALNGVVVSTVAITEDNFRFSIPLPDGVSDGTRLTALATGSVSEFGPVIITGDQESALAPQVSLDPATVTVSAGETVTINGSFFDPDSTAWTGTVDFGDGSAVQAISLNNDNTFTLTHTYAASGSYTVTTNITDNSLAVGTATVDVFAVNDAPVVSFNQFTITSPVDEGELVTLTGEFTDGGATDTHTIGIDWGDGSAIQSITVVEGDRSFTATHIYLDDTNINANGDSAPTSADVYRIEVIVGDQAGGSDGTPLGLFLEEVRNVRPSNLNVNVTTPSATNTIIEGDTVTLDGSFLDPGILDTHTVTIDWGDGSEVQTIDLAANVLSFGGLPELSHTYVNDPATGPDSYVVRVSVVDDDEPASPTVFESTLNVLNDVPNTVGITLTPAAINENDSVTLSGFFSDAGIEDAHRVTIEWGDGSSETIDLAAGVTTISGVSHTYTNDIAGGYNVTVRVADTDSPELHGTATGNVTVNNLAPVITGSITIDGVPTSLNEGDTITIRGSYTDASPDDRHTLVVNWGDGTSSPAEVNSSDRTFTATHTFVDNGTLANFDADITVTATDDGGLFATATTTINVANVAPTAVILPMEVGSDPNLIPLLADTTDVGINDTLTYNWTAQPVIANPPAAQTGNAEQFVIDRTAFPNDPWQVTLIVTDDDAGTVTDMTTLLIGDANDNMLVVNDALFSAIAPAGGSITALGLGGDDVIDATGVTSAANFVVFDGGAGNDFFYGGEGDDIFFLRDGDDAANVTSPSQLATPGNFPAFAQALANQNGDDRFYLQPNSDLTVIDNSGNNALDFSFADVNNSADAATSGVTFDLSVANSTSLTLNDQRQDVSSSDPGQHFVTAQGQFTELVGSTFNDDLTGASNATVSAGSGDDRLEVKANTVGATFSGGADNDILIATGAGIGDLNFGGDAGIDQLVVDPNSVINGLEFGGGADNDVLQNEGSVIGELIFGGDAGIDVLTNAGNIDDLIFNGGADNDIFVNNGPQSIPLDFGGDNDILLSTPGTIGDLNFGGDAGVDTFVNLGNIDDLIFNGGADNDIFINNGPQAVPLDFGGDNDVLLSGQGNILHLDFGGDDGADLLANTGNIDGLIFTGGADNDIFINSGPQSIPLDFGGDQDILLAGEGTIGDLNFGGDSGADILANLGQVSGELVFTGGADDDIFVNAGPTAVPLDFGGDNDVLLSGNGDIVDLNFGGDAGIDQLINNGAIGELIFGGGADQDILINDGTVVDDLIFGGDAEIFETTPGVFDLNFGGDVGADILENNGTVGGGLIFAGGADDDLLRNDGVVIGGLNFGGDAGLDILENNGTVGGELIFGGDAGVDVLANAGQLGDLIFTGGADNDILINNGPGAVNLNFGGDNDVLLGGPGTIDDLVFGGDTGVDRLFNNGAITDLVFTGGADNDLLQNTGSVLGGLNFGGDAGIDQLVNSGEISDLIFGGGADNDILVNDGNVFGDLIFGGDAEILETSPGVFDLNFGGDSGADVLRNRGAVSGELIFTGGADNDLLVNSGAVIGDLNFGGDAGVDQLINDGLAGDIIFSGGADNDLLVNRGTADVLNFGGDSGADVLLNEAPNVGNIIFSGGADNDILENAGDGIGELIFGGDSGTDTLRNLGDSIGNLTFGGGADNDILITNGEDIGTLIFGGDLTYDGLGGSTTSPAGGDDTLIVRGSGSGSPFSRIEFIGDAGIDAFENNAPGFSDIFFSGGADNDVLLNNAANISNLLFEGDAGTDVFENNGAGVFDIIFNGGADNDVLVNDGPGVSHLSFGGDSGADLLINNGSDVLGLTFTGDSGADQLINTGANVTNLIFGGGADNDLLVNSGPGLTDLVFTGDVGEDTFRNLATAIGGSGLVFTGGADNDLLINDAAEVADLVFSGDDGDDAFQNNGFGVSNLTFNGGADDDVFVNTGSRVSDLVFNGGADNDILQAGGTELGSLVFGGDAGEDTFVSTGQIAELVFGGGADNDVLNVTGGAIGDLIFGGDQSLLPNGTLVDTGDAGEDILINTSDFVNSLVFSGGADDDILQNNGPVNDLVFAGGADNDTLVNNGLGVLDLVFNGDVGADILINNSPEIGDIIFNGDAGPDTLRIQDGVVGDLIFNGGADADSLSFNGESAVGATHTFDGGDGNDLVSFTGSSDDFTFLGGIGSDLLFLVGDGNVTVDGQAGDDTVQLVGNPEATLTLNETYSGPFDVSSDTLDFSSYTGGPLNIDLTQVNIVQAQSSTFDVVLIDGLGLENTIGTPFADTIIGNARNNVIAGADFAEAFGGPVAENRTVAQWVLLDFDTHTNTGSINDEGIADVGEHIYTAAERDAIQQLVSTSYRGPDDNNPWFDVRFTRDINDIPTDLRNSGDFVTTFINETPDFGRPGGLASEIDLGNQNLSGTTQVQINGLLGGLIFAQDIEGGDNPLSDDGHGHDEDEDDHGARDEHDHGNGSDPYKDNELFNADTDVGTLKPAASSENFISLTAKVVAHELGHLLGLRHADSFGPIGFGLHNPPGAASYNPIYTGPVGGFETFDHILGSPASVGSTRFTDLNDLFFGEREAVKLAYAFSDQAAVNTVESASSHGDLLNAQPLTLTTVNVPNTVARGLNEDKEFFVQLQGVDGRINIDPATNKAENDWYSFTGVAGELINIDVMSNSLARFGQEADDFVDTIVRVYNSAGELVPYYDGFAENDDIFEPTDSSIVDLVLPADDTYFIEVDTFFRDANDPIFDVNNPDSPLNPDNPNNILDEDFDELRERFLDSRDDTDIGNYQLFVFRYRDANTSDAIDTIIGNGGNDMIIGGPGDDFSLSFDLGADFVGSAAINEGSGVTRTVTLTDRAASSWVNSTVDYGDGNGPQTLIVSNNNNGTADFTLGKDYVQDGTFTVTVTIIDDIGNSLTDSFVVEVSNVAPTITANASDATVNEGSTATNSGTFADPGLEDAVVVTASFGDLTFDKNAGTWNWSYVGIDDLATTQVTITATDDSGLATPVTFDLTVNNVDPTVTVSGPTTANAGDTVTFNGTATDPVDALTVVWTITQDGSAFDTQSGGTTYSFTPTIAGTYVVTLTADDGDGGIVSASQTLIVTGTMNQAPVVTISGRDSGVRGQTLSYTFTATDADSADANGPFIYTIDWSDGSPLEVITAGPTLTLEHIFDTISDGNDFNVTATAEDQSGGTSDATALPVDILRWEVQADPLYPGQTILVVGGSTGDDNIKVSKSYYHSDYVRLKINEIENEVRVFANAGNMVDRIAAYGQDGDDRIQVSLNVSLPSLLDGGAGDDLLIGGWGSSILVGQEGDDRLFSSYDRGILIGGRGQDRLYGWNSSDLLIAGFTSFDNDRVALDAIMSEWTSNRSYYHRIYNLAGFGWGSRNNGNYFLKFNQSDPANDTVHDDEESDLLWGGANLDWYIGNTDGDNEGARDRLFGVRWWEVVTDLDRI